MSCMGSVLWLALLLVFWGSPGALAQVTCQPTLTQPCAKPQSKPGNDQSSQRSTAAKSDDNEPIDHSKRIRIDKDTDFNFSFGGVGLKQKF